MPQSQHASQCRHPDLSRKRYRLHENAAAAWPFLAEYLCSSIEATCINDVAKTQPFFQQGLKFSKPGSTKKISRLAFRRHSVDHPRLTMLMRTMSIIYSGVVKQWFNTAVLLGRPAPVPRTARGQPSDELDKYINAVSGTDTRHCHQSIAEQNRLKEKQLSQKK